MRRVLETNLKASEAASMLYGGAGPVRSLPTPIAPGFVDIKT